jgi:site-specific DNA-methyltransferase (adenine-specific)
MEGDCREVMASMEAESFHACVGDPPYGLEFMGKEWDKLWDGRPSGGFNGGHHVGRVGPQYKGGAAAQEWHGLWLAEAYRVLKPGAFLLAFGGTRTWHRLACAIEDAGFELRDTVMWLHGQGFPKSLDVSKALDKKAGAQRPTVGTEMVDIGIQSGSMHAGRESRFVERAVTAPATDAARQWQGWGTALKPAYEPILVARKPLCGTVAENVLAHGCGGINVDGCRVAGAAWVRDTGHKKSMAGGKFHAAAEAPHVEIIQVANPAGRWPANVCLDEEAAGLLDEQSGQLTSGARTGGASRFFYCAKASRREREAGLANGECGMRNADLPDAHNLSSNACARCGKRVKANGSGDRCQCGPDRITVKLPRALNHHPTVKPLALMRWLVRLVTPPGGTVLDPFCGSGTTGCACALEGFSFVGIEQDAGYCEIARKRIGHAETSTAEPLWDRKAVDVPPSEAAGPPGRET